MKILLGILVLFYAVNVIADDGYVHGKDHCYYLSAPKGWVLDTISAKRQGLPMVFYPKNSSWSKATTVIYTRNDGFARGAKSDAQKIKSKVNSVLEEYRNSGDGPNIKARKVKNIKSKSGANGEVWKFTGDKWGNTEMVSYFVGASTVNFFVMTSRDQKDFERSLPAFFELSSSYREANDCVPCETKTVTPACSVEFVSNFDEAKVAAERNEAIEHYKQHQYKVLMPYFSKKYSKVLQNCFNSTNNPDKSKFEIVIALDKTGKVNKVYRDRETNTGLCMIRVLERDKFPAPIKSPFYMHIAMRFSD